MIVKMRRILTAVFLMLDHTSGLRKHLILDDLEQLPKRNMVLQNHDIASVSLEGNKIHEVENVYSDEDLAFPDDKECISHEHLITDGDDTDNIPDNLSIQRKEIGIPEVHRCCTRKPKMIGLGFDMAGNEQFVDVGYCSKSCSHQKRQNHHHHHGRQSHHRVITTEEDGNLTLSPQDPSEVNNGEISTSVHHCSSHHHHCEATFVTVSQRHLLVGLQWVTVIRQCECVLLPPTCSRIPNSVTYHPGTPYEKVIDIGKCAGKCDESGSTCHPVRNKTVFIEGPNGGYCASVIEECSCTGPCYRMQVYESFYRNVWNHDTNITDEETVEIDVGQCVGMCDDELNFHCVLRDPADPEKCLMSLKKQRAQCIPVEFKMHTFETSSGETKNVAAIENCGCK